MEKCCRCENPAEWKIKVDGDPFYGWTDFELVCKKHKLDIMAAARLLDVSVSSEPIAKSLNAAYMEPLQVFTFARCPNCESVFKDDVMLYGPLKCPNQECSGVALERGIETLDDK